MKAFLYKIFSISFLPPLFHIFVLTLGLALIFREKTLKTGRRILVFGVVLFYLSSSYAVVNLLSKPLESPFPQPNWEDIHPSVGAIVVLTGGKFYTRLRTLWGVELYYRFKNVPMLFSGGSIYREDDLAPESEIAARVAQNLGVPPEQIILETRSRNTYENALYTSEILKNRKIRNFLLVTSGTHMYRAMAAFRKNGLTPIPVPSDYISSRSDKNTVSFMDNYLPSIGAFYSLFFVLHEYVGILWYKIMGYL